MASQLSGLIDKAYRCIGDLTPIRADCGKLCGAACCQGDQDVGMLLFPGEAVRLARVPGFQVSRISYLDRKAWLLTCEGDCDRELRPLSCRMFPLAPQVGEDGSVVALPDPRARAMCPLSDCACLDPRFRRAVGKAFYLLAREPRMMDFMKLLSRELEELRRFHR